MDQKQTSGEWLELHISCRGLKNLNTMYLSDPQVYIYQEFGGNTQPVLIGQTEVVKHNLNPDFRTSIKCEYFFNKTQNLMINIYDSNESVIGKLTQVAISGEKKECFMGAIHTTLSKLMGAKDCFSKLSIMKDNLNEGQMLIHIDKMTESSQQVKIHWQWAGHDLKDVEIFSKSDPFAEFFRMDSSDSKILIHQTEVIDNNLNPTWKAWDTTKDQLCPKNDHFFVEIWDYNKIGGHTFMGSTEVALSSIMEENQNDFKVLGKNHKNFGHLKLLNKTIVKPPPIHREITFLDYLRGGWQLSMVIGIDFTFSNGPINKPDSLHKLGSNTTEMNQYQQTIQQVGGIIISYDFDKEVAVYGFGGVPKLPGHTKAYAEDCFPINGNDKNPYCKDITGILESYNNAVGHIEFAGPTFIGTILKNAKIQAQKNAAGDIYTVALIMTDGQIEDMDEAMKQISECSTLPISIIIVGVGDEDFSYMHKLDNIEEIRKHTAENMKASLRDITQFVAYKEFKNNGEALCAAVLNNFPKQFMHYMKLNNRQAREAVHVQLSQMLL